MEYINTVYKQIVSYDNIRDIIIDHTPFTGADDNWLDITTFFVDISAERCCRQQFVAELHNWSS